MKSKVIELLQNNSRFLIVGHVSPDGDTLGSITALSRILSQEGKEVFCAVDDKVPDKFEFLCDVYPIMSYDTLPLPEEPLCVVAVDCGDVQRLGRFGELFLSSETNMVIDHHMTNPGFGKVNLVCDYGATGQIIVELLEEMGRIPDEAAANALYAAISTDTGNFSYSNVDESILHTAAKLRGWKADIPALCETLFKNQSQGHMRLMGKLLERMELLKNGRIAVSSVFVKDYESCGAKPEDCEELVSALRNIDGVELAVFIKEKQKDEYRISLRSKEYADVSKIAVAYDGGGHLHAAGCTMNGPFEEVKATLIRLAKELIDERNN